MQGRLWINVESLFLHVVDLTVFPDHALPYDGKVNGHEKPVFGVFFTTGTVLTCLLAASFRRELWARRRRPFRAVTAASLAYAAIFLAAAWYTGYYHVYFYMVPLFCFVTFNGITLVKGAARTCGAVVFATGIVAICQRGGGVYGVEEKGFLTPPRSTFMLAAFNNAVLAAICLQAKVRVRCAVTRVWVAGPRLWGLAFMPSSFDQNMANVIIVFTWVV